MCLYEISVVSSTFPTFRLGHSMKKGQILFMEIESMS